MKTMSKTALLALLFSSAVTTSLWANPGPSTGTTTSSTGTTTTGSTPKSPTVVAAPNSPAAASSGAVFSSPTGVYKGTGSSPQNQATGDVQKNGTATKP